MFSQHPGVNPRKNLSEVAGQQSSGTASSFSSLGRDVLEHSFEVHPVQVQVSTLPRRAATRWDLHEALFLVGILGNQVGFGAGSNRKSLLTAAHFVPNRQTKTR